ncbi:hypothetical protein [Rhodanobacter sp. BL-MT-08]
MHLLDPDYLPKTVGTLGRFLLNPKADVDGLLLDDGTEIYTPPHLSEKLLKALSPGDKLTVHGVKTRDSDLIVAVAIDPAKGKRIVDDGPDPKHEKPKKPAERGEPTTHVGVVSRLLHGPKGNAHGALLEDGTLVRFPPHGAEPFASILVAGAPLAVRGHELTTKHGSVVDARAMGKDESSLTEIAKPPKPSKHDEKTPKKDHPPKHHAAHH